MRMVRISNPGLTSPRPASAAQARDLDESKLRLILAAESLFAERGIDSVSLREIGVTHARDRGITEMTQSIDRPRHRRSDARQGCRQGISGNAATL